MSGSELAALVFQLEMQNKNTIRVNFAQETMGPVTPSRPITPFEEPPSAAGIDNYNDNYFEDDDDGDETFEEIEEQSTDKKKRKPCAPRTLMRWTRKSRSDRSNAVSGR